MEKNDLIYKTTEVQGLPTSNGMRLLIATPLYPPDIGGPATYAKILHDELPKKGITTKVLSFGGVRNLPKGFSHLAYAWKIFRALSGADLVLALDPVSVGLPSALSAKIRGKDLFVKIVGDYAWEQGAQRYGLKQNLDDFVLTKDADLPRQVVTLRRVQTFVAKEAKRVIVPSEYLKRIIISWGIPAEKIAVVYNAFDKTEESTKKDECRKELGISGTTVLSAGRLVPWKGFSTLINLVPKLKEHIPDMHMIIAGSGPLEATLKKEIAEKHIEGVTLLGKIERNKLLKYVKAADCFVLNTGYEGLSHQLLEVMSLGTPIVTTRVGGNTELIENGKNGLLVDYDDKDALFEAISRTVTDKEKARKMAGEAITFASGFTVERMVSGTIEALTQ